LACLPLSFICDVSYYGDGLDLFPKVLRRSILFWDWKDIPGWSGIRTVKLNQTNSDGTSSREGGGDDGVSDIQGVANTRVGTSTKIAAIVSAVVAAAFLILITYLVLRRKKDEVEKEIIFQDLEITDDEDDYDKLPITDIPFEKSYVVTGGDEIERNEEHPDDEGSEVLAMRIEENFNLQRSGSLDDSLNDHYPTRYLVTNSVNSYDSRRDDGTATIESNTRSYRIPDNTVDL
jgi:hypothetical protein